MNLAVFIYIAIFAESRVNTEAWLCEVAVIAAGLFPAVRIQSLGYFVNAPIKQISLIYKINPRFYQTLKKIKTFELSRSLFFRKVSLCEYVSQ